MNFNSLYCYLIICTRWSLTSTYLTAEMMCVMLSSPLNDTGVSKNVPLNSSILTSPLGRAETRVRHISQMKNIPCLLEVRQTGGQRLLTSSKTFLRSSLFCKTLCYFLSLCSGFSSQNQLIQNRRHKETQQVHTQEQFLVHIIWQCTDYYHQKM